MYGRNRMTGWFSATSLAIGICVLTGCGKDDGLVTSETSNYQVAEDDGPAAQVTPSSAAAANQPTATATRSSEPDATAARPPVKPSSLAPAGVNPTEPAGDTAADLMRFIGELQDRQPAGTTQDEALADFQQTQRRIISTAEQLLAMASDDQLKLTAVDAKIKALMAMMQLKADGAAEAILRFCDELRSGTDPVLAAHGNSVGIQTRMYAFVQDILPDPQPLVDDFRVQLGVQTKDANLLELGRQVASLLEGKGHPASAQDVLHEMSAAFATVEDPALAPNIASLYEEADFIAVDARNKFVAVIEGRPGAEAEFLATAQQLLNSDQRGDATKTFLLDEIALRLESMAMEEFAANLIAIIGPAFAGHPNRELAEEVRGKVERFSRRNSLVGQRFSVDGVDLEGKPVDWSQYSGKVVLVDFWATWCTPCLEEMSNIKTNYDRFRDQGFEVIGINLDEDRESLVSFFSVQQLPWPTVLSADPETRGMQTPLAQKCGVEFIPFIVLVGRDGRVAALNVRGTQLGPKLAELLAQPGPPATGG